MQQSTVALKATRVTVLKTSWVAQTERETTEPRTTYSHQLSKSGGACVRIVLAIPPPQQPRGTVAWRRDALNTGQSASCCGSLKQRACTAGTATCTSSCSLRRPSTCGIACQPLSTLSHSSLEGVTPPLDSQVLLVASQATPLMPGAATTPRPPGHACSSSGGCGPRHQRAQHRRPPPPCPAPRHGRWHAVAAGRHPCGGGSPVLPGASSSAAVRVRVCLPAVHACVFVLRARARARVCVWPCRVGRQLSGCVCVCPGTRGGAR